MGCMTSSSCLPTDALLVSTVEASRRRGASGEDSRGGTGDGENDATARALDGIAVVVTLGLVVIASPLGLDLADGKRRTAGRR